MTYRPPEEALDPGITELLSGIELFSNAIKCRYDASEPWDEDHLRHLSNLDIILTEMKHALYKLRRETW